jgi:hypothetical protein
MGTGYRRCCSGRLPRHVCASRAPGIVNWSGLDALDAEPARGNLRHLRRVRSRQPDLRGLGSGETCVPRAKVNFNSFDSGCQAGAHPRIVDCRLGDIFDRADAGRPPSGGLAQIGRTPNAPGLSSCLMRTSLEAKLGATFGPSISWTAVVSAHALEQRISPRARYSFCSNSARPKARNECCK